jgi:hypothetical protein
MTPGLPEEAFVVCGEHRGESGSPLAMTVTTSMAQTGASTASLLDPQIGFEHSGSVIFLISKVWAYVIKQKVSR